MTWNHTLNFTGNVLDEAALALKLFIYCEKPLPGIEMSAEDENAAKERIAGAKHLFALMFKMSLIEIEDILKEYRSEKGLPKHWTPDEIKTFQRL